MSATPKRATRAPKREAMSRAVFTSRWCDPYLPVQNGLTTEGEIISQISRHPSARVVCFVRTRLQVNKSPKKSRARRSGIAREERVFRECHLIYLFTRRSSPVTRHSRFSSHGPSSHSKGQYPTREARSGRSIKRGTFHFGEMRNLQTVRTYASSPKNLHRRDLSRFVPTRNEPFEDE
jgi:hypothetical protein